MKRRGLREEEEKTTPYGMGLVLQVGNASLMVISNAKTAGRQDDLVLH